MIQGFKTYNWAFFVLIFHEYAVRLQSPKQSLPRRPHIDYIIQNVWYKTRSPIVPLTGVAALKLSNSGLEQNFIYLESIYLYIFIHLGLARFFLFLSF